MELKLFYDETARVYYLFIPAYTDKEHIDVEAPEALSIQFSCSGEEYSSSLSDVPLGEPIELSITTSSLYKRTKTYTIELLQSDNLPALFIDAPQSGLYAIHQSKANKTQATIKTINVDGTILSEGECTLTGRGNSTWKEAKRPYNLKFANKTSLVNNDSAFTWCLLSNYSDDSQVRNAFCNYIARAVGIPYTSDITFVSLYINGTYQGLYNIATKQTYMEGIGKDVAVVFENTREDRTYSAITAHDFCFRTWYGDTARNLKKVEAFERALYDDEDYSALERLADMELIARKYWVDAFCGNSDLALSQYYMISSADRLEPLCAWDYDNTFGLSFFYLNFAPNMLDPTNDWYNKLFTYDAFRQRLVEITDERSDLVQSDYINALDSICSYIAADWLMNMCRWRNQPPCWGGRNALKSNAYELNTLEGQKAYIIDYINRRVQFLRNYWAAEDDYCKLTFYVDDNYIQQAPKVVLVRMGAPLSKTLLPDGMFSMPEEGFVGWTTQEGVSIDDVKIIDHDYEFYEQCSTTPRWKRLAERMVKEHTLLTILLAALACLLLYAVLRTILRLRRR